MSIQSADHTVRRPYGLKTLQSAHQTIRRPYSPQTMTISGPCQPGFHIMGNDRQKLSVRQYGPQTKQSPDHTVRRPNNLQIMQSADYAVRRPDSPQNIEFADHLVLRPYSPQTIQFADNYNFQTMTARLSYHDDRQTLLVRQPTQMGTQFPSYRLLAALIIATSRNTMLCNSLPILSAIFHSSIYNIAKLYQA